MKEKGQTKESDLMINEMPMPKLLEGNNSSRIFRSFFAKPERESRAGKLKSFVDPKMYHYEESPEDPFEEDIDTNFEKVEFDVAEIQDQNFLTPMWFN